MPTLEQIESEILSIIDPEGWDAPNCSHADIFDQPPAKLFLKNLETFQKVLLGIATGFVAVVLILAFIQWHQIWNKVSGEKRQNKLYYLISLFPVSTLCCYIGMAAPRTALVLNSLGVLYVLICLVILISLIKHLFGGRKAFSTTLAYDDRPINLQSPPFCCCCKFLPQPASNEVNIRRLEWCVIQAPIVRAVVVAFNIIVVSEFRDRANVYLHRSELVAVGSLLLAIFGMHTLARLTTDKLRPYGFMTIFRLVDIALLFFTAQQPMLFENILVRFKVIDCGPLMSAIDNARFICNFVIICELALLSIVATWRIRPATSALFEVHAAKQPRLQPRINEDTILRSEDFDA